MYDESTRMWSSSQIRLNTSDKLAKLIKPEVELNKPIYPGATILGMAKLKIYQFRYQVLKTRYPDIRLCFTGVKCYWLILSSMNWLAFKWCLIGLKIMLDIKNNIHHTSDTDSSLKLERRTSTKIFSWWKTSTSTPQITIRTILSTNPWIKLFPDSLRKRRLVTL